MILEAIERRQPRDPAVRQPLAQGRRPRRGAGRRAHIRPRGAAGRIALHLGARLPVGPRDHGTGHAASRAGLGRVRRGAAHAEQPGVGLGAVRAGAGLGQRARPRSRCSPAGSRPRISRALFAVRSAGDARRPVERWSIFCISSRRSWAGSSRAGAGPAQKRLRALAALSATAEASPRRDPAADEAVSSFTAKRARIGAYPGGASSTIVDAERPARARRLSPRGTSWSRQFAEAPKACSTGWSSYRLLGFLAARSPTGRARALGAELRGGSWP